MGSLSWAQIAQAQFKLKVARKHDLCGFGQRGKSKKKRDSDGVDAEADSGDEEGAEMDVVDASEETDPMQQQCPMISFREAREVTASDLASALSRTVYAQTNHGNMKRARLSGGKCLRAWTLGIEFPKGT